MPFSAKNKRAEVVLESELRTETGSVKNRRAEVYRSGFSLVIFCFAFLRFSEGSGKPILNNGGFELRPGQSVSINAPPGWSGRFWDRRGCSFDASGKGTCVTGDCGGDLQCAGAGGARPTKLAEFTLGSPLDFYGVSIVDGYDLTGLIVPVGGSGICKPIKCISDLNRSCPRVLQVRNNKKRVVACKSACMAFSTYWFCCAGVFGSPKPCKPAAYPSAFKAACPTAHSYAYDDATSTFTCKGANYLVSFC
ncbi:hypothetical protein NE237_005276 [Protea cynaroides]|uniref:Thaumatin-like protein n=1 Tax=Protea cynaroides TaxID=273540 RepID=A0A9Q0QUF1_9MAGN|nr:hypothetical protein NE237_005276 [Protea cynaroides]